VKNNKDKIKSRHQGLKQKRYFPDTIYLGATTKGHALKDATRSAVGTRPGGRNCTEVDPSTRTLDIAKRKPNNMLKRREQSKRDQILTVRIETKNITFQTHLPGQHRHPGRRHHGRRQKGTGGCSGRNCLPQSQQGAPGPRTKLSKPDK
jgi:hypothetical protein